MKEKQKQLDSNKDLMCQVIEHAMKITDDAARVELLRTVDPFSPAAASALGLILAKSSSSIQAGSPLHVFVSDSELDKRWRRKVTPSSSSLWAALEFLSDLYGPADQTDPLERYLYLYHLSMDETFG